MKLIQALLSQVRAGLSAEQQVKVEVDRGLGTSPLLVEAIQALGVDFLFRVQGTTRFKSDQGKAYPLRQLVKMANLGRAAGMASRSMVGCGCRSMFIGDA